MTGRTNLKTALIFCGLLVGLCLKAEAYSGGSGTAEDPYQIATAEDLIALGNEPNDYDKHFILTTDIDLEPNLPGGRVFDRAVIAPDNAGNSKYSGIAFAGVFDGCGQTIDNLLISASGNRIGLFGCLSEGASVKNLRLEGLKATGGYYVGGLAGTSNGTIVCCYISAEVAGDRYIGGLVGENNGRVEACQLITEVSGNMGVGGVSGNTTGSILSCTTQSRVEGDTAVGGLTGYNWGFDSDGLIRSCHSDADVSGQKSTGGLVGYTTKGLMVSCTSTGTVEGQGWSGGLVGQLSGGTVTQCSSTTRVTDSGYGAGGLIGWNNGGVIEESFAAGQVHGGKAVGGLVGRNSPEGASAWPDSTVIRSCYGQGDISGTDEIGGLVGRNDRGTVYSSYSTGRVVGSGAIGGLVGQQSEYGPVRLCYWDMQASGMTTSAAGDGRTTNQLMTAETFIGWGDGVWRIDEGHDYPRLVWEQSAGELIVQASPLYGGGTGTSDDPYQIWAPAELINLACCPEDYDKHFVLMTDLDFVGVDPNRIVPIGMELVPFVGVFEGRGHSISNLTYENLVQNYVGLFGCLGPRSSEWTDSEGVVRNLHMIRAHIGGRNNVGAIAGYSSGTILACSASGQIEGAETVGGLVGANWGIVEHCSVDAIVSGTEHTGGLVGYHKQTADYRPGWLHGCHTGGGIHGDSCTGGLVGSSYGVIESCYSQASVQGGDRVGGLLGVNEHQGLVTRCYSTGPVTGARAVGGLIGISDSDMSMRPLAVMSYWDVEASGVASSAGGYGRVTNEMFWADTFEWWGPCGDWTIDHGADYPRLVWENSGGDAITGEAYAYGGGSGRPEDPFQIWTAKHFAAVAEHYEDFDKSFVLMADIDCTDVNSDQLQPIGTYLVPFTGLLDGNGYTISNFHYEAEEEESIGLIGYLSNRDSTSGMVRDVSLVDVIITGDCHVGGLVGYSNGGKVIACDVSGRVTGSREVGGLFGVAYETTIDSCYVRVDANGYTDVGGVTGFHRNGQVFRTKAACNVSGHERLGGLFGSWSLARWSAGADAQLSQCAAVGTIRGHHQLGGLIGHNTGLVTDCSAACQVIGEQYVENQGILGPATVLSSMVGGMVGSNDGQMQYCYSVSGVTGDEQVGGFVGIQLGGQVLDCLWDMQSSGVLTGLGSDTTTTFDASGVTTAEMQEASTFLDAGWDFIGEVDNGTEDVWWIEDGVDYPRLWWELGE